MIQQISARVTPVAATALMAVVTQQIALEATPVAATALEVAILMAVVMQQIALGVVPVEVTGQGVTAQIVAEIEVIQQVVYDVRESVSCLLAMTVS